MTDFVWRLRIFKTHVYVVFENNANTQKKNGSLVTNTHKALHTDKNRECHSFE